MFIMTEMGDTLNLDLLAAVGEAACPRSSSIAAGDDRHLQSPVFQTPVRSTAEPTQQVIRNTAYIVTVRHSNGVVTSAHRTDTPLSTESTPIAVTPLPVTPGMVLSPQLLQQASPPHEVSSSAAIKTIQTTDDEGKPVTVVVEECGRILAFGTPDHRNEGQMLSRRSLWSDVEPIYECGHCHRKLSI